MARDSAVRLGSTTARLAMIRRVFTKTNKRPTDRTDVSTVERVACPRPMTRRSSATAAAARHGETRRPAHCTSSLSRVRYHNGT